MLYVTFELGITLPFACITTRNYVLKVKVKGTKSLLRAKHAPTLACTLHKMFWHPTISGTKINK